MPQPPANPVLATDPQIARKSGHRVAQQPSATDLGPKIGMNPEPEFFPAALEASQIQVLRMVSPFIGEEGFYLGGGTALAIQLGHRKSVDFDWFHPMMPDPEKILSRLDEEGLSFQLQTLARGTLHGQIFDVRVSFLSYHYPLVQPLVTWPQFNCSMASIDDLIAMKLAAIAQRGARKDFIDIFAIHRSGYSLDNMLALFRDKYKLRDIGHLLVALAFFDDADREPMPTMIWPIDWDQVKQAIRSMVKEHVK